MAFEAHAKTEAVADILVFKRREIPDFAALAAWCQLGTADAELFAAGESVSVYSYSRQTGNSGQQRQTINRHFREHPASVLGKLKWTRLPDRCSTVRWRRCVRNWMHRSTS
jgi:hypothetical protein